MSIYLPIAQYLVSGPMLFIIGMIGGFIGGSFGMGGGFFTQPMIIAYGIQPTVAITSVSMQSACAIIGHLITSKKNPKVDYSFVLVSMTGGILGIILGTLVFKMLSNAGYAGIALPFLYVPMTSILAFVMIRDGFTEIIARYKKISLVDTRGDRFKFLNSIPYKVSFATSGVSINFMVPIITSFFVAITCLITSMNTSFVMISIMSYVYRMPVTYAIPTAMAYGELSLILSAIIFAISSNGFDVVLTAILMLGSTVGIRFGKIISKKLNQDMLKLCLGLMMLLFSIKTVVELFIEPMDSIIISNEL